MKKLIKFGVILAFLLTLVPVAAADDPFATELIADGGTWYDGMWGVDVGEVQVWNDSTYLYVKYVIDAELDPDNAAPTLIYQTHLEVATDPADIPQTKKGNPIPGRFTYSDIHDPGVTDHTYRIPMTWAAGTPLIIAAHAIVKEPVGGVEGLVYTLPDTVTMRVTYPYGGGPAYFPHTDISGGTILDGVYEGWCVDTDHTIAQNTNYTANVYSSYETLPAGTVDFPENLDLVNWILNQGYVGQPSACGGVYTYGDVQRAIWTLVDPNSTSGLGPWSQCRVDEILAGANVNGEGYVPGCDDVVAVVLAPVGGQQVIVAQAITIGVEVPCEDISETAWGEGTTFDGNQWGMYFTYTVQ